MIEKIDKFEVDYQKLKNDFNYIMDKAFPSGFNSDTVINNTNVNGVNGTLQINLRGQDFFQEVHPQNLPEHIKTLEDFKAFFSFWHESVPEYTKNIIETLCRQENYDFTRARYLFLAPGRGLTLHRDAGIRYHFVIETNPGSLFYFVDDDKEARDAEVYHLEKCNYFYKADTRRTHFFYNSGNTVRIHLVIS